jgi:hypothetical protein
VFITRGSFPNLAQLSATQGKFAGFVPASPAVHPCDPDWIFFAFVPMLLEIFDMQCSLGIFLWIFRLFYGVFVILSSSAY